MKDIFGIDNISKALGVKLEPSGLKLNDTVILNPKYASGLFGSPISGKKYKEIYQKKINGKIVELRMKCDHYSYGEYASIEWMNGKKSEWMHTSWLKKIE